MTAEAIAGVARATRPGILRAENAASICGAHMRGVREEGWKIHGLTAPAGKRWTESGGGVIQRMARQTGRLLKGGILCRLPFGAAKAPRFDGRPSWPGALRRHPFVFRLCFVECDRK